MVYENLASNPDAISEDINRKLTVARRTGKLGQIREIRQRMI
jgi:hypothetical protein